MKQLLFSGLCLTLLYGTSENADSATQEKNIARETVRKTARRETAKNSKRKRPSAALTPAEAGPDFPFQGEYVGSVSKDGETLSFGVQVIALGNGKFQAVGYPGGLPGAGWTGDRKIRGKGSRSGDMVTLQAKEGSADIRHRKLTVKTADGTVIGTLKKVVRKSPTLGAKPPKGAIVLFDGTSSEEFLNGRMTKDGFLREGTMTKRKFQGCKLHLEFLLSFMPQARGQGRSNSGVYLQGRYEVQLLDSFGLEGKSNECGGIYGVKAPDVNMCFPPLQWQTYDIEFTPARFDANGKKTADARITVWHNGVKIHNNVAVPKATRAARFKEGPEPGPIYIQNHGNPLLFRNIWIVEK